MHQLQVNPDGSERLEYTMKGLPVRISTDRLRIFQEYAAACHWHDDFELLAAFTYSIGKMHTKPGKCAILSAFRAKMAQKHYYKDRTEASRLTAVSTEGTSPMRSERRPFCSRKLQRRGFWATNESTWSKASL